MATAGNKPQNVTFTKYTGKSATAFVKGVGVFFSTTTAGALEIDVAVANSKCIGVFTDPAATGDGTTKHEVALLAGGGTVRVKASGTCTAGEYAVAGTDGFENQTAGGGTTVKHVCGVFLETGVDGDFVEMALMRMPAVSA
jgi:hypothetical protein